MIPEDVLTKLVALGVSREQAAAIAAMLKRVEQATQEDCLAPLRRRRQTDAARQSKKRRSSRVGGAAPASAADDGHHVMSADVRDPPSLKKELPPRHPPIEKNNPTPSSSTSDRDAGASEGESLENRCRELMRDRPVVVDPDFGPVRRLLEERSIIEADVLAGVAEAAQAADFRPRSWEKLEKWVRHAAKDRLECAMGAPGGGTSSPGEERGTLAAPGAVSPRAKSRQIRAERRLRSRPNGTRIDPQWEPCEADWAFAVKELGGSNSARRELEKFRDYWTARARDATRFDWAATWRNWVRKEAAGSAPGRLDSRSPDPRRRSNSEILRGITDAPEPYAVLAEQPDWALPGRRVSSDYELAALMEVQANG